MVSSVTLRIQEIARKRRGKMRKLLNLFGMALIAAVVFFPVRSNAAGKIICQTLKEAKTYHYNLDKKGKEESIRINVSRKKYKTKESDYDDLVFDAKAMLTINGKKIYTKVVKEQMYMSEKEYLSYTPIKVMITDIDKGDKQMELFVFEGDCVEFNSGQIEHLYYYQYTNGRAKRKQDLVSLFHKSLPYVSRVFALKRNALLTINEKNEVMAEVGVDIPNFLKIYLPTKVNLILKDGKFIQKIQKSYRILEIMEPIRAKKKNIVYTSPGGKEKAFTVKKKEKIKLCNIYLANKKKIYVKVKNQSGKTGYIDPKKASIYWDVPEDYYD